MIKKRNKIQLCPCGSEQEYHACCGQYIESDKWPCTAEQLMRSRYSAYALKQKNYLLDTWHRDTLPENIDLYENAHVKWVSLKVLSVAAGCEQDKTGTVEFMATMKANGKAEKMTECSEFVKQDGRWYYVKAQEPTIE